MKIWEIKAQALRMMFTDSDIQFNEEDWRSGAIYGNYNTRDKLVRMNDSIRRAIDYYYLHVGRRIKIEKLQLKSSVEKQMEISGIDMVDPNMQVTPEEGIIYDGELKFNHLDDVDRPMSIKFKGKELNYYWEEHTRKLQILDIDFSKRNVDYASLYFDFAYKPYDLQIPNEIELDEMEFDLNEIDIPQNIQNMICYYVKGELYEEDEADLAGQARNIYLNFLYSVPKRASISRKKVKSNFGG